MKSLPEHRLAVEPKSCRRGVLDLLAYLHHGIFRELQDAAYFARVGIQFGAVTWPHGQDIAPETLQAEWRPLQAGGNEPSTQN